MVSQLNDMGLLGPDTTYIHCNYLSDDEFKLIADTGGKVSIAPTVEMIMGHGTPPTAKALAHGLRPSLSIDVVTTVPGDMFTQMRFLFAQDRLLSHEAAFAAGNEEEPQLLTSREVLEFATGPGFFKVEQDRALALVDDAVDAKQIDDARARKQLEEAQAALELIESGESDADRWQVEQRVKHAENQLAVGGRG
jgi:hypothetical protein